MSILSHPHPDWCDPRLCSSDQDGTEHRGDPLSWSSAEHRISVGHTRYDETLTSGESLVGPDRVRLRIEDERSLSPAGEVVAVELDLPGADARLVSAALAQTADRISYSYRRAAR